MALPGSGAISFDNLRTERAVAGSVSLADMYKGGSKVPVTAGTTNIPTSGAIDMADFYSQQLYPYGLTFVSSNSIGNPGDKVVSQGFSLGTTTSIAAGSSNGSFKSGNGTRLILVQQSSLTSLQPLFFFAQKTTSAASNSSDVHAGSISGISSTTISLRNGTATSGSTIFSGNLSSTVESTNGPTILTSSSAYQANNQLLTFQINGLFNNSQTMPALSNGSTYTWTFG